METGKRSMVIWSLRWCGMNRWRTKNIQGVKIFCIYHNIGYIALVIIYCPNQCIKGFSGSSVGKESSSNAGDPGWIPGQGRKERLPTLEFLASLVAQLVKNLPAIRETWVRSLGWEDPLEKGKAMHSSILAQRIPWIIQTKAPQSQTQLRLSFISLQPYQVSTSNS